jgi:hypothetical protein
MPKVQPKKLFGVGLVNVWVAHSEFEDCDSSFENRFSLKLKSFF